MWTCPRNRSQVAAPPRKSHVPGDRALVQEARDGQGVGGALGHVQGLTALGQEEDPGQGHGEDPGHVPVEEHVPGQGREVAHLLMELDSM